MIRLTKVSNFCLQIEYTTHNIQILIISILFWGMTFHNLKTRRYS
ncbi:hypothetical protein TRIP_E160205 [uncultured Spirochaetota bacterium]|nr:hypothetical protein TRIP_E160205 [uncultured Spirochaetota bacterium]